MDLNDSFSRQRRSLMAVSLTLLAYVSAGVSLEKLSIFGNAFSVSRPSLIPLALWIAWGYFTLRYYQLFRDLHDPGPAKAHARYLDQIAIRRARASAPAELGPQFLEGSDPKMVRWSFDGEDVTSRGMPLWRVSLSATARSKAGRTFHMQNFGQTVEVGGRLDRVRAWLSVGMHTRFFTEYGLPILVGLAPVAAWVTLRVLNH